MPVRAYLFDADGEDKAVRLTRELAESLNDRQVLWVDVHDTGDGAADAAAEALRLWPPGNPPCDGEGGRPSLRHFEDHYLLNIQAIDEQDGKYRHAAVCLVFRRNLVATVHTRPVGFLDDFAAHTRDDTDIGRLTTNSFLAAMLGGHVTGFFRIIEAVEGQVDRLDALALRDRDREEVLGDMTRLRRRVAFIRRTLTPHREAYAALARPDFQIHMGEDAAEHFGLLAARLERAIESVENARDLVVGSFDMFATQTALRTNEAMKVLTLSSFIWFPASVVVGITALLLRTPVDPFRTIGFWLMLGAIVGIIALTLFVARRRRWI